MPTFNTRPPTESQSSGYRLLRTPTNHALQALVLSDNILGCNTHFVGNRTIPCENPNCEPCASGISWRWHGYLLVMLDGTHEKAIFEMTARASTGFQEYFQRHTTLRGCKFKASRLNQRNNGRILIQLKQADLTNITLPDALPLEKLLCHIWNIPENQSNASGPKKRPPFDNARIDRSRAELPAERSEPSIIELAAVRAMKESGNGTPKKPR